MIGTVIIVVEVIVVAKKTKKKVKLEKKQLGELTVDHCGCG